KSVRFATDRGGADSMSKRKQPGPGAPSGLAALGSLAWVRIRPSGKKLWVSILAVALAACFALGVYIHSLSPDNKFNNRRVSSFPQYLDRRLEEELTRTFTLGASTNSTGSTDRGGNSDEFARDGNPGRFGGLNRLDGLGRDFRGLGELMSGIADMKLEGLQSFELDIDLDEFDSLKGIGEFTQGLDDAFGLSGSEAPGEGSSADSQPTHSLGSTGTARGRPLAETAGRVGITLDDAK
ncbi:MAG: hypothetical protein OXE53_12860, partial [Deltaproteobacteria bacterium]|nr:hypothetical protein [Deltaproteobacteria bacterium]